MAQLKSTTVSGRLDVSDKVNTPKINATEMYTLNNVNLLDIFYPVGSIYMSTTQDNSTKDTANKYGCPIANLGGKWERVQGRFLLASGDNGDGKSYTISSTGGSKDAVVVTHTHGIQNKSLVGHLDILENNSDGDETVYSADGICRKTVGGGHNYLKASNDDMNSNYITIDASHTHTVNAPTNAVAGTDKNMPPYLVVYMWKRIAD